MRTVEIDLDVHKHLEGARNSFKETENAILRRLLGIDTELVKSPAAQQPSGGRAWLSKGVSLPHGTKLRARYRKQTVVGEIRDGGWLVGNDRYSGPSPALQDNVTTAAGTKTQLNGWIYWQVRRPGDEHYIPLDKLRPTLSLEDLDL